MLLAVLLQRYRLIKDQNRLTLIIFISFDFQKSLELNSFNSTVNQRKIVMMQMNQQIKKSRVIAALFETKIDSISKDQYKYIQIKMKGRIYECKQVVSSSSPLLFSLTSSKQGARVKLNVKLNFSDFVQIKTDQGTLEQGIALFDKVSQETEQNVPHPAEHSVNGSNVSFSQENEEMFQRFAGKPKHKNAKQCLISQAMPRSTECRICQEYFVDYVQHIKHPTHMKLEAIHRAKSAKMFDDLLDRFEYQTKRIRSQKILPNHDFEDEDFMSNRSVSKIRLISDQSTVRIEKKKTEETHITSTASITGKRQFKPLSIPSLLLLP